MRQGTQGGQCDGRLEYKGYPVITSPARVLDVCLLSVMLLCVYSDQRNAQKSNYVLRPIHVLLRTLRSGPVNPHYCSYAEHFDSIPVSLFHQPPID